MTLNNKQYQQQSNVELRRPLHTAFTILFVLCTLFMVFQVISARTDKSMVMFIFAILSWIGVRITV